MHIEYEKIKNDEIESLKNQLNLETNKRKSFETKYYEEIEQSKIERLGYLQEIEMTKNEYDYVFNEMNNEEKQNTLGMHTAMLFHDLRNPLNAIINIPKLIETKYEHDKLLMSYVKLLENASEKMIHLIDDTLETIRKAPLKIEKVNVKTIFDNIIRKDGVLTGVQVLQSESTSEIECDKSKMESVFTNIIYNSVQAMNNDGIIKIKIIDNNNYCEISIEDNGPGIPDKVIGKIFQPLFTTKQTGTGLGLGICKNIVNQHKGEISVKNNPTTFIITLPKVSDFNS